MVRGSEYQYSRELAQRDFFVPEYVDLLALLATS